MPYERQAYCMERISASGIVSAWPAYAFLKEKPHKEGKEKQGEQSIRCIMGTHIFGAAMPCVSIAAWFMAFAE